MCNNVKNKNNGIMTQNPKYLISFRVLVCRGGRTVADIHLYVGDTVSLTQRGPAHWVLEGCVAC